MVAESNATKGQQTPSSRKKKTSKKRPVSKKSTSRKSTTPAPATASDDPKPITSQRRAPADTPEIQPGSIQSNHAGSGVNTLSWIAIILSGLALCAGGYAWYLTAVDSKLTMGQQKSRFSVIEQRIDGFDTAQSDLNNQISQLKNQISQAEDNFSSQARGMRNDLVAQESAIRDQISSAEQNIQTRTDKFRQEFGTLSDSIVKLRSELGRSIDSWTLEEAEQLMFIANQRLYFAGDTQLSRRALQFADDRLQRLADPALNNVRQLLATEIAALDSVKMIDTGGVLNNIAILASSVENLSLAGDLVIPDKGGIGAASTTSESDVPETEASGKDESGIESYTQPIIDAGSSFISSLGDLIQIEKNGKSVKPVISAEARKLNYDYTRMILESAQIAFVRQDPELYKHRMQSARNWVEERFDTNSAETTNWLAQLDNVASNSPRSELPDISGSLNAIREIINSQN
jgi:uroporphyrin-3 C-methyltransferase